MGLLIPQQIHATYDQDTLKEESQSRDSPSIHSLPSVDEEALRVVEECRKSRERITKEQQERNHQQQLSIHITQVVLEPEVLEAIFAGESPLDAELRVKARQFRELQIGTQKLMELKATIEGEENHPHKDRIPQILSLIQTNIAHLKSLETVISLGKASSKLTAKLHKKQTALSLLREEEIDRQAREDLDKEIKTLTEALANKEKKIRQVNFTQSTSEEAARENLYKEAPVKKEEEEDKTPQDKPS
ncbi:hypothetical protein GQ61_07435 [Candidatus Nucleicultrix amoebiphila FS5]|jgi:AraC-like DNA-binding protein|uniref:Uncharacterized protein n=2 Tax=Candidatus Nucleicultrix TaxID=1509243 RepID=A0A1W6N5T5_9PROT|nr:hypothetical protein GQ61_07435 [Candidatus Nucleicultrix amoebiphila FS5]